MMEAMIREIHLRADYLQGDVIKTIYFGGGTPSILPTRWIARLLAEIHRIFEVSPDAEVTLEANPDDIHAERLKSWSALGINRLSIGIQTFDDERLKFLNRIHSGQEAQASIQLAQDHGFQNLTCDLIYAIPPEHMQKWEQDVRTLLAHQVPHISMYGLTIEEDTAFGKWRSTGKLKEVSEAANARQYEWTIDHLKAAGFEHYEVSNFCQPGMQSRHNSAYWLQTAYLGLGPGAHSYDGGSRSYAVSNNALYIKALTANQLPLEVEILTPFQKANEYVLTRIRTHFGVDLSYVSELTGIDLLQKHGPFIHQLISQGMMEKSGKFYRLTSKGMFNADEIALKFFLDEAVIS